MYADTVASIPCPTRDTIYGVGKDLGILALVVSCQISTVICGCLPVLVSSLWTARPFVYGTRGDGLCSALG